MKIKTKRKSFNIEELMSVDEYAKLTNQTRINVYYHIKNNSKPPFEFIQIAGTYFIIKP